MRRMLFVGVTVIGAVVLAACEYAGAGIELRESALDRTVGAQWCAASEGERNIIADRRGYSSEFVAWLDSRC